MKIEWKNLQMKQSSKSKTRTMMLNLEVKNIKTLLNMVFLSVRKCAM